MFKFGKTKPIVLSQSTCVPLNAAMLVIKLHEKLCAAPIFVDDGEVVLKDVTIEMNPFSDVVDREGGKVYEFALSGHYEAGGIARRRSYGFAASIFVRLYKDGKTAPRIAYEGWHDLTLEYTKLRVLFEAPDRLKFAAMKGEDIVGPWYHSDDAKPLDELPCQEVHSRLYDLRIRTLGHLKAWKRSKLLEQSNDTSVVAGAEKILARFGYQFTPE